MVSDSSQVDRPCGPNLDCTGNEREKRLAEMLRTNCKGFITGMGPLLLRQVRHDNVCLPRTDLFASSSEGYLPESVEKMKREASTELQELRVRLYSRWMRAAYP